MLYDGAIRFLQQAMEAIRNEDAEQRYDKLARAGEIIVALRTALDLSGDSPEIKSLDAFYQSVDTRILALHHSHNLTECADIIARLREIRDVWDVIDRT